MDKKTEDKIISIVDEQVALKNVEALAGNVVKEEFHKGAIFGIKLILDELFSGMVE